MNEEILLPELGKLLTSSETTKEDLNEKKNWKTWISGVAELRNINSKRANNRIKYWITKAIRDQDNFYKRPFTVKAYKEIEKEYAEIKYKRKKE